MTEKQAFARDDAVKFIEARDKEMLALEAQKTWREVGQDEWDDGVEIIPAVLIYTVKRDGRYKARLV